MKLKLKLFWVTFADIINKKFHYCAIIQSLDIKLVDEVLDLLKLNDLEATCLIGEIPEHLEQYIPLEYRYRKLNKNESKYLKDILDGHLHK